MKNIIKTDKQEYKISPAEPGAEQEKWKSRLALVSSFPNRFVGIIEDDPVPGQSFKLYGALMYIAELSFQPVFKADEKGQPLRDATGAPQVLGIRGGTKLHVLIPYDLLGPATIECVHNNHILWVKDQPEEVAKWITSEYTNYFDPPKIVQG